MKRDLPRRRRPHWVDRLEFHRNRQGEIEKVIDMFKAPGFAEASCLPTCDAWDAARETKQAFDNGGMWTYPMSSTCSLMR
jgi:hypothetical protein